MYFSNNRSTMQYRTSTKDNKEQVKIVTGGYPETTLHKGSMDEFSKATGIVLFGKGGRTKLSERQIRRINIFLNNLWINDTAQTYKRYSP